MHGPGHRLSDLLLGLIPVHNCAGPYLALEEAARLVFDSLSRSDSGGWAATPMSPHGPLADDGRLYDDDD